MQNASVYIPLFVKKKKIEFRSACPISTALDIFGDKWSLLIIRDLMFKGKNTYGDFLSSEEKIATNILADRLALLEMGGVVTKHNHPKHKLKMVYKLTPKGIDLILVLIEIISWSVKHQDVHPYAREFAKAAKKDRDGLIKQVRENLKT